MSYQALKPVLNKFDVEDTFFHEGNYTFGNTEYDVDVTVALKEIGVVAAECVQHHGGEGQGDEYYTVWKFEFAPLNADSESKSVYVMFNGWYASYHGSEYTDMYEVEPKEVVVTEYHVIK